MSEGRAVQCIDDLGSGASRSPYVTTALPSVGERRLAEASFDEFVDEDDRYSASLSFSMRRPLPKVAEGCAQRTKSKSMATAAQTSETAIALTTTGPRESEMMRPLRNPRAVSA
jgi:hypothetical protein